MDRTTGLDVPRSAVGVGDKDADVDAEDGEDDAEERDGRELADELDADEHTDEHEQQQHAAVDPVAVVRVLRDVDRTEQLQRRRRHVLLHRRTPRDDYKGTTVYFRVVHRLG